MTSGSGIACGCPLQCKSGARIHEGLEKPPGFEPCTATIVSDPVIKGLWESNWNRASVVLVASQLPRDELGFDFKQEVNFKKIYSAGTVFCEEIRTSVQAQRMTTMVIQAALARKGVAVPIVPADVFALPVDSAMNDRPHLARVRRLPVRSDLMAMAENA